MLQRTTISGLSGGLGFFWSAEGRSTAFRGVIFGIDRYGSYRRSSQITQGGVVYYDPASVEKRSKGLFATEVYAETFGQQKLAEQKAKEEKERAQREAASAQEAEAARINKEVGDLLASHEFELREYQLPQFEPKPNEEARRAAYEAAFAALGPKPETPAFPWGKAGERATLEWRQFVGLYEAYETTETREEETLASYGGETWGTGYWHPVTRKVVRWMHISGDDLWKEYRAAEEARRAALEELGDPPPYPAETSVAYEAACEAYRESFADRLGVPLYALYRALERLKIRF